MKKIVVLTGAGVSAESGLDTFRDSGGLWEKFDINDVATPEGFFRNPGLVLDFYNKRRQQLINTVPNAAHVVLASLQNKYDVDVVTQNVDDLHERAGSCKVLHLHGELMKVRSTGAGQEVFNVSRQKTEVGLGDLCPKGYQLRPHIVWFGEAVPAMPRAVELVERADVLVIIGTSMNVYPANTLIRYFRKNKPVYVIDPNKVANLPENVIEIRKKATEGVNDLLNFL